MAMTDPSSSQVIPSHAQTFGSERREVSEWASEIVFWNEKNEPKANKLNHDQLIIMTTPLVLTWLVRFGIPPIPSIGPCYALLSLDELEDGVFHRRWEEGHGDGYSLYGMVRVV